MSRPMLATHLPRVRSPLGWVLVAIALLHLSTLFPGLGGRINTGDSAKFQFLGSILGISHPPGNPLYLLLSALWVRLPWPFSPATRVTLLSFAFGMLALLLVARALSRSFGTRAAVFGVIALGAGPLFWTFATEAEVYSLNACLVAASCEAALRFEREQKHRALFGCAAFALLGCANHATSVMLLPAVAALIWNARNTPARFTARSWLALCLWALACAGLYAYIPVRAYQHAPYSELLARPTPQNIWLYISAARFQQGFVGLSPEQLIHARMPAFVNGLQKQWAWPFFLLLPFGFVRMRARTPRAYTFLLLALAGFSCFALTYEIPDPEGFFVPIVTLLALPLGVALAKLSARSFGSRVLIGALALCFGASAHVHVREWQRCIGRELVYSIGDRNKHMLLDFDDLFARIPEGASFVLPCNAYGCVQVINYYRFADPTAAQRRIRFVRPPELDSGFFAFAPPERWLWAKATQEVACALRKNEAREMARQGAQVRTIERPAKFIDGVMYPGVPIYCSEPRR